MPILLGDPCFMFGFDPVKVLASEETTSQRTPGNQSIVVFLVKGQVLYFMHFASKHIVLTLSADGFVKVVLLTDGQSIEHLLSIPVTGSPIEGLTIFDYFVEATANLLDRSKIIVEMRVEDVHIIELETL